MKQHIWEVLAEQGISEQNPATWKTGQQVGFTHLRDAAAFQFEKNPAVTQVLDDLLGEDRYKVPYNWGQLLVSFPEPNTEWTIPHEIWHTDFDFLSPPDQIQGVLVFSFLAEVRARSGGTLVIAGSHRLVKNYVAGKPPEDLQKMKKVRQAIYQIDPWLQRLTNKEKRPDRIRYFMNTSYSTEGIPLFIEELTGKAGDVIIGHPWLLHATSSNCGQQPRMMCVHRIHIKKE